MSASRPGASKRSMRPTIALAPWKIAVDLTASRAIQQHASAPATGCRCDDCTHWRRVADQVLPEALAGQLALLGLDIHHPSDLYAMRRETDSADYRVAYHIVGKIMSGPIVWRDDAQMGEMLIYHWLRTAPALALAVMPSSQSSAQAPAVDIRSLICIDIRLTVPSCAPRAAP